jgi:hypothetical protein
MKRIDEQMQINHDYELAQQACKDKQGKELRAIAMRMFDRGLIDVNEYGEICFKNQQLIF